MDQSRFSSLWVFFNSTNKGWAAFTQSAGKSGQRLHNVNKVRVSLVHVGGGVNLVRHVLNLYFKAALSISQDLFVFFLCDEGDR